MIFSLILGLVLGVIIDLVGGSNKTYLEFGRVEIASWFDFIGVGFLKLIQLLAIPVVFLSIIKVVIEVQADRLKALTGKTFFMLLGTTAISAAIGILVVKLYNLNGASFTGELASKKVERIAEISSQSFPEFFLNLVPSNIFASMADNGSIVSVVIVAALFAVAIRYLKVHMPNEVSPLVNLIDSLKITVHSVLSLVIEFMPYGIVALVSNTIIANGLSSVTGLLGFIAAIYTAVIIMLLIYAIILLAIRVNPITFYKKAFTTLVFAFSSRSSAGTLPYTLNTLENDMGVSSETSNFVATLATSIGMNGCAGVFPAMLGVLVASSVGTEMSFAFYMSVVLVVTIGSIGIAGVPGTATVAATVTLNGLGYGHTIGNIGAIFGIDPIVDMGRTMLNVAGSMLSAVVVDKWDGTFDQEKFDQAIKSE
ncbi:cation:dicarboxylate symporter family transporter [Peptostreptococcus faecalis]|uniref:cation:dicarboxylate symporter family transporter n=1 Tax=Peptostreptococcus faecalis TaxID=2045015 RepID=UPI001A9A4010|nr:cation:dicarboxylase symporter family transporter [Peptostreptococcus faecalis]